MIKLFLVEDEIVMRDGIKSQIDWKKEDIEFAGEASDGELAYPMILETKPDILLTDIKMPFMDGLELSFPTPRGLSPWASRNICSNRCRRKNCWAASGR